MSDIKGSDLFDEKGLGQIFLVTARRFPYSAFNSISTLVVALLLLLHACAFDLPHKTFLPSIRSMADIGVSYGSAILGFLIAGFTIFATLTKPRLLVHMYLRTHKRTKLNYLKYNFFAFVEVFTIYLLLIGASILVVVLGGTGGSASALITKAFSVHSIIIKDLIVRITYVGLGTLLYYALVALKSFIYNIYHIVITLSLIHI